MPTSWDRQGRWTVLRRPGGWALTDAALALATLVLLEEEVALSQQAEPKPALAAVALLVRLGAMTSAGDRLEVTPLGRRLQRWPVHVRLARMLVEGRGAPNVAAACALLAEGAARGQPCASTVS